MAYWGYFEFVTDFLSRIENPQVVEVGVDKGQFFVPLLAWLKANKKSFSLLAIDVWKQDSTKIQIELVSRDLNDEQHVHFFEKSSLDVLPDLLMMKNHNKIHVMLLDGDHNYYTVKRELDCIKDLMNNMGIVVIDDYGGEGGKKDEFFAEHPQYANNNMPVKREEAAKEAIEYKGVKGAVDEFLKNNKEWTITDQVVPGFEPVVMYKKEHIKLIQGEK